MKNTRAKKAAEGQQPRPSHTLAIDISPYLHDAAAKAVGSSFDGLIIQVVRMRVEQAVAKIDIAELVTQAAKDAVSAVVGRTDFGGLKMQDFIKKELAAAFRGLLG